MLSSQDYYHFLDVLKDRWKANIHSDIVIFDSIKKSVTQNLDNYKAEKIVFKNIDLGRNRRPIGSYNDAQSFCELFIDVEIDNLKDEIKNPFKNYSLSIKLLSQVSYLGKKDLPVKSSWHLDKDDGKSSDFTHPEYHFQFGGNEMIKTKEDGYPPFEFGNVLLLEAPRFMHPPMDIILAIDFIVHNFYKEAQRKDLVKEKSYIKAVKNARNQFWKPYALAFASNFHQIEGLKIDENFKRNILGDSA